MPTKYSHFNEHCSITFKLYDLVLALLKHVSDVPYSSHFGSLVEPEHTNWLATDFHANARLHCTN